MIAREEGRGVGQGRGDPEPLAGPASQIGDGGGHSGRDDDERDEKLRELAEQVGEVEDALPTGKGWPLEADRAQEQGQQIAPMTQVRMLVETMGSARARLRDCLTWRDPSV